MPSVRAVYGGWEADELEPLPVQQLCTVRGPTRYFVFPPFRFGLEEETVIAGSGSNRIRVQTAALPWFCLVEEPVTRLCVSRSRSSVSARGHSADLNGL